MDLNTVSKLSIRSDLANVAVMINSFPQVLLLPVAGSDSLTTRLPAISPGF